MIVLGGADPLDRERYRRVVSGHEPVAPAPNALAAVDAARERMLAHLAGGASAYGITTGLGYLAGLPIAPERQAAFQHAVLMRGTGHGPPFAAEVVRGAMLLRLNGFLRGWAAVSSDLCRFIADRLNDGFTPWVPSRGITSAGEVVALSHLFQTFVGTGTVLEDGVRVDAGEALARRGVAPFVPAAKEGIALVNGAPLAPAVTARLLERCEALLEHATLAGALAATLSGTSLRPYTRRVGRLKGDPGQLRVHERLAVLTGGADAAAWADRGQGPVSFRVLPQVHGAVADLLDHVGAQLDRELEAVTDSPLYLDGDGDEPEGFYPSGNFHSQALCVQLDALAIAFAQVANLSEKRLHRLLDRRFSGLPDQLAVEPGHQTGLIFLHKSVIGFAAETRLLASPASVHPVDTSAGQEDFQAFTFLAAEKLERILDTLELIVASELIAARQARHLRGAPAPPRAEAVLQRLAASVEPVVGDRPLSADVERVAGLIRAGALLED